MSAGFSSALVDAIRYLALASKELLSLDEAATYLHVASTTLADYARRGEVASYKRLGRVWFRRSELDEWVYTGRSASTEEIDRLADKYIQSLTVIKNSKR